MWSTILFLRPHRSLGPQGLETDPFCVSTHVPTPYMMDILHDSRLKMHADQVQDLFDSFH